MPSYSILGYSDTTFFAGIEVDFETPADPIDFDDDRINPGGHYDASTGIYTVPLDGTYEFNVQIESYSDFNNDWGFWVLVDGIEVTFSRHDASGSTDNDENVSLSSTVLLNLTSGQEVWVKTDVNVLYGTVVGLNSWFSGHIIYAE